MLLEGKMLMLKFLGQVMIAEMGYIFGQNGKYD
jgi:hypothetical protein